MRNAGSWRNERASVGCMLNSSLRECLLQPGIKEIDLAAKGSQPFLITRSAPLHDRNTPDSITRRSMEYLQKTNPDDYAEAVARILLGTLVITERKNDAF